jgi:Tol biopolymer transport system component
MIFSGGGAQGVRGAVARLVLTVFAVASAGGFAAAADLTGTLAFVSDRSGQDEIYIRDLASGVERRITENAGPDRAPSWSPDGRWIAFNSRRPPHEDPEIYILRPDTLKLRRLTRNPAEDQRPAFTADGKTIVFQRGDFTAGFGIWSVRVDDRTETQLTKPDSAGSFDAAPDPSPVNGTIVLQTNRRVGALFPFRLARLVEGRRQPRDFGPAAPASIDGPRWSPDGRQIAFAAGGDLYVFTPATSRLKRVTSGKASDLSPDWSPDGTMMVFQSDRRVDTGGIHVLDLDTGAVGFVGEGRTPVWTERSFPE